MDPRSEVVLRQQQYLASKILLINPPADELAQQLTHKHQVSVWTWNFADHQYFQHQSIQSDFAVTFPDDIPDQVIIFVPK